MNKSRNKWDNQLPLTLPHGLGLGVSAGQVNYVPPSLQENKMAGQTGFIDLKWKRGNIPSCVVQPSEGQPHDAQSRPYKAKLTLQDPKIKHALEQKLAKIKLEPGSKGFAPNQVLPNFDQLPDPTLSNQEKELKKIPVVATDQPTKTFTEGPVLPLSEEENADVFGVALRKDTSKAFDGGLNLKAEVPDNKYTPGTVKFTTSDALKDLVNDLQFMHNKNTGCIVNETCAPEFFCYEEEVHFVSGKSLGRGSYGCVDLCFDSKTQKPFVRKQLPKSTLRTSEIIVPSTLNHHNITKFYGLIQRMGEEEGNPIIELLIEYGGFALNKYYQRGQRLTTAQIWEASKQAFAGLVHINHYSIVHLDIKPENICIEVRPDGSIVIKLTDFGSSRLPQEPLKFIGLTPEYLAPEICKMFLQAQQQSLDFGLTEDDITGKVDTFAFGLVIMYLYKGYHILVKVINNGNTSYDGVAPEIRKLMHINLMALMADNRTEFVHNLIPDECDLDMRDLLTKLTRHCHQDRFSARQALDFIEGKEQRSRMVVKLEQKERVAVHHPLQYQVPNVVDCNNMMEIPGIAEDCMESDNGPVKNKTKDALRMKLNPYNRFGKKGKKNVNSKTMHPGSPVSEMYELRQEIASKQMPMTPICEFEELSIGQSLPENLFQDEDTSSVSSMTDRRAPIAQPSTETSDDVIQVTHQPVQQPEFSAVRPTQQVEGDFNCIRPTVRPIEADNVVSLGGRTQYPIATQQPGLRLNIPLEVVQQFLLKKKMEKIAARQQTGTVQPMTPVQPEIPQRGNVMIAQNVQPEVINLDSSTDEGDQMLANAANSSRRTLRNSPLQMETEDCDGPALPKFAMFL